MNNTVFFEIQNRIAFITLNRPEVFNSFNRTMALALQEIIKDLNDNDDVRVITITGAGKAFSAGQDLAEAVEKDGPSFETILMEHYNPIIRLLRSSRKPIIAAVNGVAAGAGANIALACDIVVASKKASFIQAFSKIGLIPDSGGTYFLPRLVGIQKALAIMMTGDKISAVEAEQMGLIYKVFEEEDFKNEVERFVLQIAEMPTKALGYIKLLINESLNNNLEQQLSLEVEYQKKAGLTYDFQEGVNAFLEKRKAIFKGK